MHIVVAFRAHALEARRLGVVPSLPTRRCAVCITASSPGLVLLLLCAGAAFVCAVNYCVKLAVRARARARCDLFLLLV